MRILDLDVDPIHEVPYLCAGRRGAESARLPIHLGYALGVLLLTVGCGVGAVSVPSHTPDARTRGSSKQVASEDSTGAAVEAYLRIVDQRNLILADDRDEERARAHLESFAESMACDGGGLRLDARALRFRSSSSELGAWSQEIVVLRADPTEVLLLDRGAVFYFGLHHTGGYERVVMLQRPADRWIVSATTRPTDVRCLSRGDRDLVRRARRTRVLAVCLASHGRCEERCEEARERDWARLGLASCQRCFFDECACGLARCIGAQGAVDAICEGIP